MLGVAGFIIVVGIVAMLTFWRLIAQGEGKPHTFEFIVPAIFAIGFTVLVVGGILAFVKYGAHQ